ncbi:MAG TPA: hypothetical protein VLR26_17965, partial [Frankiaceae bacterium]|nr:hypothetical protein [Frankiaceae bacterium]
MTARTLLGTVVSHPEQRVVDDDAGIVFWVRPALQEHLDPVQVFVSARSADLVERVDLSLGAIVQATGQQSRGILIAGSLTSAALELPDDGANVTVPLPVPELARLDPGRAFRYRTFMVCWFAAFVTLGLFGMVTASNRYGAPGFGVFLAGAVWLVVRDLRVRSVDNRQYQELARSAAALVEARLEAVVPVARMFDLLGGGIERTGNPWNPTRARQPRPEGVEWADQTGRFAATIKPIPLQPKSNATITARRLTTWSPADQSRSTAARRGRAGSDCRRAERGRHSVAGCLPL